MKRRFKAAVSVVLCCALVLTTILSMGIASAATSVEYFTNASGNRTAIKLVQTDDGKTYYAVGDGGKLVDSAADEDEFYTAVLTAEYNGKSPAQHWANVASAVFKSAGNGLGYFNSVSSFDEVYARNEADLTGDFILTDVLSQTDEFESGKFNTDDASGAYSTGLKYFSSLNAVQEEMQDQYGRIIAADEDDVLKRMTGRDNGFEFIESTETQPVIAAVATSADSITLSKDVSSFALAFYDFQLIPFVEDGVEYVTAAEGHGSLKEAAQNGVPGVEFNTSTNGSGYTSYATNPSKSDSSVSVSFSESSSVSVSNSMESSKSYTYGMEIGSSTKLSVSIEDIFDVEQTISANFSTAETIGTAYGTTDTLTQETETASVAQVVLPAHTKLGVNQTPSNIQSVLDYDCPVYVTYKVAMFSTCGISLTAQIAPVGSFCTVFGSDVTIEGLTAVDNLYERSVEHMSEDTFEKNQKVFSYSVNGGIAEIDSIDWETVTGMSPANGHGKVLDSVNALNSNIPLSAAGATVSVVSTGLKTDITAIEPLYELSHVRVVGEGVYYLAHGGNLDLNKISTEGFDEYHVPYYGYIPFSGYWTICDKDGNDAPYVTGITLSNVSNYQTVKATVIGEYYLKFHVDETLYPSVAEDVVTPIIKINVTKTGANHTCTPGPWRVTIPATCFMEGEETQCCSICGLMMFSKPIDRDDDHSASNVVVDTPPTCTADGSHKEICGVCNHEKETTVIPATGHDDGIWKIDFEATADHDGQTSRYCTVCDAVLETKAFSRHNHEEGHTQILTQPTCSQNGEKGIFCSACDVCYKTEVIPATGHTDGNWVVLDQPNCTDKGQKVLYCETCGETIGSEEIEAKGHNDGVWLASVAPTCTKAGEEICVCTDCDTIIDSRTVAAEGHDDGVWKIDFEPTADHDGQTSRYCSKCDEVLETKAFTKHEHKLGYEEVITPATCTVDGIKGSFCSSCGVCYKTEAIPATGHGETIDVTTIKPTCTEKGEKETYCVDCGMRIGVSAVEANGHTPGAWVTDKAAGCETDGEKHQSCTACGATIATESIKAHGHASTWLTAKEATCSAVGREELTCTICDAVLETRAIKKADHIYGKWNILQQPTCTIDGLKQQICAACDAPLGEPVAIKAHDHNKGVWQTVLEPTCTTDGEKIIKCTICSGTIESDVIPALGHNDGVWTTSLKASCETAGEKHKNCTRCGHLVATERVDALGHTPGPAMTCVTNQVCLVCEEILIPADGKSHTWTEWETYKEASFFVEEQQKSVCSSCGIEEYRFVKGTSKCHKFFPHCDGSGEGCWACETLSNTNGFFRNLGKFLTWFFFENIITTVFFPFAHGHFHEDINLDKTFGS